MRKFGLHSRKGLGQHFLVDPSALEASVSAAELSPRDVVVEIGPGLGVLTEELATHASKVIAVEVDSQIAVALESLLSSYPGVRVVNADILQLNIADMLDSETTSYKVVANLPYYVASPIIRRFLEAEVKPERMVVMVQKEVADNMTAPPGKMSLLSVSVQVYGNPSIVMGVPASGFHPSPKVDSAIVRIDVYKTPRFSLQAHDFFKVVRAGFSAPRKQLRNSLANGLSIEPSLAGDLINGAGISPKRRAETLSIAEWSDLCKIVNRELQ
ncbi:MAG: 16S rRNA (adenine(1518)-N(6)/adenine(1519)-N(6))-dimethyltransferase RsmA [Dehalococcoidia bacterium]